MAEFEKLACIERENGVEFALKVVPGAARDRLGGLLGDALKVYVTAPPEDGRANAAVIHVLVQVLGVRTADCQIVSGHSSPRKRVRISGLSASELRKRLSRPPSG